jgi:hypothetical protein
MLENSRTGEIKEAQQLNNLALRFGRQAAIYSRNGSNANEFWSERIDFYIIAPMSVDLNNSYFTLKSPAGFYCAKYVAIGVMLLL